MECDVANLLFTSIVRCVDDARLQEASHFFSLCKILVLAEVKILCCWFFTKKTGNCCGIYIFLYLLKGKIDGTSVWMFGHASGLWCSSLKRTWNLTVVVKFFTEVMISSRCMNSGRCGLEVPVCNPVISLILFTKITTLLSVVFMALFFFHICKI